MVALREDGRHVERLSRATLVGGPHDAVVRADGSYIVTGGLGGLGTVVARWLVERGAGRIVLNGRSEPSDEQREIRGQLAAPTSSSWPAISPPPGVAERLVAAAEETGRAAAGIVHGAGVTGDGLVAALTRESLERVWAPKVAGALRLNAATADTEIDWWVGFSSMATMLGLPGQLAYATGNAWLDALMTWRRASGRPATAIDWGQWSAVGMSSMLTYSVLDPITPDEGIEALESLVGGPLTRVGVGRMRLDRAVAGDPGVPRTRPTSTGRLRIRGRRRDRRAPAGRRGRGRPRWRRPRTGRTLSAEDRLTELRPGSRPSWAAS